MDPTLGEEDIRSTRRLSPSLSPMRLSAMWRPAPDPVAGPEACHGRRRGDPALAAMPSSRTAGGPVQLLPRPC